MSSALHRDLIAHPTDTSLDDLHPVGYIVATYDDLAGITTWKQAKAAWVEDSQALYIFDSGGTPRRVGAEGQSWQAPVKSASTTTPPGSPATGDRYIVPDSATGDWAGHEGDITEWDGAVWQFETPTEGWAVWVNDQSQNLFFDGTQWVPQENVLRHDLLIPASLSWVDSGHTGTTNYTVAAFGASGEAILQSFSATPAASTIPVSTAGGTLALSWYPDFGASGTFHAKGAVPDPGAAAGSTKFLREDASWAVPPGVTNHAALSNLAWNLSGHSGTAYTVAAFNSTGAVSFLPYASAPAVGTVPVAGGTAQIAAGWYPDFVASGTGHAKGAVPDPGALAGTTKYLREDGTWVVPPGVDDHTELANLSWTLSGHTDGNNSVAGFDGSGVATVYTFPWTAPRGGTGLTAYALGDTLYASATNTLSALAGNTTTTKKFLAQTGTGTVSAAPAWSTLSVGDIPSHNLLSATHGDTTAASVVRGDLIIGQGIPATWSRKPLGAQYTSLVSNGVDAVWGSVDAANGITGILAIGNGGTGAQNRPGAMANLSPLTTKGDLFAFNTDNDRLPIGTDGYRLTADSTQPFGMKWAAPTPYGVQAIANVNTGGVGLFKQMSGYTAQFYGVGAVGDGAGKLSYFIDATNNIVKFDVTEGNLSLNNISGTLNANKGGTGMSAYAVGDILYATTTSTLGNLADVATGNALISGGVNTAPAWGKIGLGTHVSGTLAIGNGGTGQTTATAAFGALSPLTTKGDILVYTTTNTRLAVGTDGQFLVADSAQAAGVKWATISYLADPGANGMVARTAAGTTTNRTITGTTGTITVTNGDGVSGNPTITISASYVGQTSITTLGTITTGTWAGTPVAAVYGGTGFATYAVGDLLVGSTSNTLTKLADVATGNALISGGVGVSPSWGKVGLTTHISGTLAIGNGGTGQTTATAAFDALAPTTTQGDIIVRGASSNGRLALGTTSYVLQSNGTTVVYGQVSLTAGVTGTLPIGNGGTGQTTATAAFGALSPLTTKGDLLGYAAANVRIPVGTDGQVLQADSTNANGVKWTTIALTGLPDPGSNGMVARTAAGTTAARTVTGTTGTITVTNGDGVSGNPTITISASYVGQTSITTLGTIGTGTWQGSVVAAGYGGTGQSTYAVGDILYASGSTALSKLTAVATGNALISGGVTTAPSWGKIGLTTHVSGTLPVGNGGTGTATAFTQGSVVFAGASGVYSQDNANFYYDATNHRLAIGATTFDATEPEKFKVEAGTTTSSLVGGFYGTINDFFEVKCKNKSSGTTASCEFAVEADTGTESSNFLSMGINSSTNADPAYTIGAALDSFIFCNGGHLTVGTETAAKTIKFHTGGTLAANERVRITDNGLEVVEAANPTATSGRGKLSVNSTDHQLRFTDGSGNVTRLTGLRHQFMCSAMGQMNNNSSGLAKHCTATTIPPPLPTTDASNFYQNGNVDSFLSMNACKITKVRIAFAQAAVAQATVGSTPAVRIEFFSNQAAARTSLGTADIVVPQANVQINNNMGITVLTTAVLTLSSPITVAAGTLWGAQFTSLNANNNQVCSVGRLEVIIETEETTE